MLFKTYSYYEMNEDGEILENDPHFITLRADVDPKEVESKLNSTLTLKDTFEYDTSKTEFIKFDRRLCKDRFSNSLPTFRSFDSDPEVI
jgi:hypothetical protein